tara:strand:- start:2030 stop:2227 length:198 start_codon:yes stop_codon:yes gene_type:complete
MNLRSALREKGMSVDRLSIRLGLSKPTLRKYLAKPEEFRIKHLRKISEYLQLTEREALNNYFIKS